MAQKFRQTLLVRALVLGLGLYSLTNSNGVAAATFDEENSLSQQQREAPRKKSRKKSKGHNFTKDNSRKDNSIKVKKGKKVFGVAAGGGGVLGLGLTPGVSAFANVSQQFQAVAYYYTTPQQNFAIDGNKVEAGGNATMLASLTGGALRYFPLAGEPYFVEIGATFRAYWIDGKFENKDLTLDIDWITDVWGLDALLGTQWQLPAGGVISIGWAGMASALNTKKSFRKKYTGQSNPDEEDLLFQRASNHFDGFEKKVFPLTLLFVASVGWSF